MVGSAVAAYIAHLAFYTLWPAAADYGRLGLVLPFLPLTSLTILATAIHWSRTVHPSLLESLGALSLVELIVWAIIAQYTQAWFLNVVLWFWTRISLFVAPWWLVGVWIGRRAWV
jgi:hypothetical protein